MVRDGEAGFAVILLSLLALDSFFLIRDRWADIAVKVFPRRVIDDPHKANSSLSGISLDIITAREDINIVISEVFIFYHP